MKLERCTEEQFLIALDDFGPWNQDNLAIDLNQIDHDGFGDMYYLYIEINPWQHYRAEYRPGAHTWQHAVELARDIARSEDPDTFNSYVN